MENKTRVKLLASVYEIALSYLQNVVNNDDFLKNECKLEEYFAPEQKPQSMNAVADQLFVSLQNKTMAGNVIGYLKSDRNAAFKKILFNCDIVKILNTYDESSLMAAFEQNFTITHKNEKTNLWRQYANSIISGCTFLNTFDSWQTFDNFVKTFIKNQYTTLALPLLLSKEINGFGFALSCDFLKELGYTYFPKPDVHIKDILFGLSLCENNELAAFKTIVEMANATGETAYKVDKILWLIASGRFYLQRVKTTKREDDYVIKGTPEKRKKDFINFVKEKIT